jgi:hypothetical protein
MKTLAFGVRRFIAAFRSPFAQHYHTEKSGDESPHSKEERR